MQAMRSSRTLATAIVLALSAGTAQAAGIFSEDFQIWRNPITGLDEVRCQTTGGAGSHPFPSGWLLRNVDNRTPDAQVAYVNEAWEVREDFKFGSASDCAMFSTSWYSPAGAANDWAWTPAIAVPAEGGVLRWRAVTYDPSYPDGYEVRVMTAPDSPTGGTGVIGNQITSSTQIFAVAAEAANWTERSVSLYAYAGQTVYIGFHNNSVDKFLLVIDDVAVLGGADLAAAASGFASDYAFWPEGFTVPAGLGITASNVGGVTLSNVTGTATLLRDGVPAGPPLLTDSPQASLASAGSAQLTFPAGSVFSGNGSWSVQYDLSATESETNTGNNHATQPGTSIGGLVWTRFAGTPTATLGIGAGNGGEIGTQFTLTQPATFVGVRYGMNAIVQPPPPDQPIDWAGRDIVAYLHVVDVGTGKPGAVLASTVPVVSSDTGGVYDALFTTGPQTLAAGTYVVTVAEPVGGAVMPLIVDTVRFKPGTIWVNWPTSPAAGWANVEFFGGSFQRVPQIGLLIEQSIFKDSFDVIPTVPPSVQVEALKPVKVDRPQRSSGRLVLSQGH